MKLEKWSPYMLMLSMVILAFAVVAIGFVLYVSTHPTNPMKWGMVQVKEVVVETSGGGSMAGAMGSIDETTGLVIDEHYDIVKASCTACHSGKLIAQNRATREGWKNMIVWMQQTQKLWDLGENEAIILDYLEKNYAPQEEGRRPQLENIEWYVLED